MLITLKGNSSYVPDEFITKDEIIPYVRLLTVVVGAEWTGPELLKMGNSLVTLQSQSG